jgi:uncharacterized protein (DUF1800 family)
MANLLRLRLCALAFTAFAALSACSRGGGDQPVELHASLGQVKPAAAAQVSRYAAARFADQVSFGATPALVADIESKGFSKWIDEQFALPVSQIDTAPIAVYDSQIKEQGDKAWMYATSQHYAVLLNAPDQLRRRVSWSLSQFVTVSSSKVEPYGGLAYANFLQRHAFSNYGDLIRDVTINPSMAVYLDNLDNRPTSTQCPWCAPNENYARELMQLFTLGVVKLGPDGTVLRDSANRPIETYSQKDVEELARALTGWRIAGEYDRTDFHRYDGSVVPDSWAPAHDRGAKTVLGTSFPAGAEAPQELNTIVSVLMGHPNIAPFVSLRLIQHMVTSDPTPAYLARVAAAFRNNGQGVAGDMKAVVRAILLDPEARRGDQLGIDVPTFGKMREPVLWYTSVLRGMSCKNLLYWPDGLYFMTPAAQSPFSAASVFSFYLPTDRAPGSNLLAPEQRLLNAQELAFRMGGSIATSVTKSGSGCAASEFGQAFNRSPQAFADLVSERFFRGAMPATLRQNLIALAPDQWGNTPDEKAVALTLYALASPYYGVMK